MGLEFVIHAGGSFGYTSFLGFDPKSRVGVVVLSNASHYEVGDIGQHLLNSRYPILGPKQLELSRRRKDAERQTAISIDRKLLESYAGVYKGATETWAVRQEGTRLFMQDEANLNKGYTKMEILPKGGRDFFFLGQDSEVMFDQIRQGRSPGLTLYDEDRSVKRFQRIN
jgi:serine-type D-Ala-D-Ala carboxypeptidase/endopeptidase